MKRARPITRRRRVARASPQVTGMSVLPKQKTIGFAQSPPRSIGALYSRGSGTGGTGSTTTRTELGVTITDFFDYTGGYDLLSNVPVANPVYSYFWDCNQNLFQSESVIEDPTKSTDTFNRVRKLMVYVMPTVGIGPSATAPDARTNADQMFTVNCQVPALTMQKEDDSLGKPILATNTRVTNVLPSINPRWHKVFSCDLQKTFQSGVARPFFALDGNLAPSGGRYDQCLFQMSVCQPATGDNFYFKPGVYENAIKVKVVLHIDQPVQPYNQAHLRVWSTTTFARPNADHITDSSPPASTSYDGTKEQYCQIAVTGKLNNFR